MSLLTRRAPATGVRAVLTGAPLVFALHHEVVSVTEAVGVQTFLRELHLLRPGGCPEVLVVVPESHAGRGYREVSGQESLEVSDPLSDGDSHHQLRLPVPDPHTEHCLRREVNLHERLEVAMHSHQLGPPGRPGVWPLLQVAADEVSLCLLPLALRDLVPAVESLNVRQPRNDLLSLLHLVKVSVERTVHYPEGRVHSILLLNLMD